MEIRYLHFPAHGDDRGQLIALEEERDFPFKIKRVYYMYDTIEGVSRGHHAHLDLEQVLICVHGSCQVFLDDGTSRETVKLDDPCKGLYLTGRVWREMHEFSPDAVLLVLASEYYDEKDYIRDYEEFLSLVKAEENDKESV